MTARGCQNTMKEIEMKKISAENLIWMLSQDPTASLTDMIGGNK
tara:strand:+ start:187 stop:318 length:132 start_codon:yes stop_codon:yes gene_type:complete